eukprot:jgi/Mesen1/3061/ME000018S02375
METELSPQELLLVDDEDDVDVRMRADEDFSGEQEAEETKLDIPDCRNFQVDMYKASILKERKLASSTVLSAKFAAASIAQFDINMEADTELYSPGQDSSAPEYVCCASSSGQVSIYSFSNLVREALLSKGAPFSNLGVVQPLLTWRAHEGAAYNLATYGTGAESLLLRCRSPGGCAEEDGAGPAPVLEMRNAQHRGPRGSLAEEGHVYTAAGDGCAYAWDVATGQQVRTFRGHADYLHCIASCPSRRQVITGSEDGTARVWDIRSAECVAAFDPWRAAAVSPAKAASSSSRATSSPWMCGTGGQCATLFSLHTSSAAIRFATSSPPQALAIDANDEIVMGGDERSLSRWTLGGQLVSKVTSAVPSVSSLDCHPFGVTLVAGYGGTVDILSEFGSHICTFFSA